MNWLIDSLNQAAPRWWAYIFSATWQSSLVALTLLGLAALLRRRSSPLRYGLLLVALIKFAVPPMASLPVGVLDQVASKVPDVLPAPAVRPMAPPLSIGSMGSGQDLRHGKFQTKAAPDMLLENLTDSIPSSAIDIETKQPIKVNARLHWQAWLMLGYMLGIALFLAWIMGQFVRLMLLARMATEYREGPIFEHYYALAKQLGMRRIPRLLILGDQFSPIAFGAMRPVVMISRPMIERLTPAELRTIFGHELAHHCRLDPLCNWCQLILAAIWWFNPIFWLLSRSLRHVREDCCDDLLLVSQITSSEAYCETILHAGQELSGAVATGTALGFAERLHPLHRRLRRIMDASLRRAERLSLAGLILVALISLGLLPGIRTRAAESTKKENDPPSAAAPTPPLQTTSPNEAAKSRASISGSIRLTGKPRTQQIMVHVLATGKNPHYVSVVPISALSNEFLIDWLEPGVYDLTFRSEEIKEQTVRGVTAPSSGLLVELEMDEAPKPALPVLRGVALDAATSRPLTRFRVRISLERGMSRGPMGISGKQMDWHEFSDPQGRFELKLFGPGVYRVEVAAEGYAPRWRTGYNSETERGKLFKMALTSGATLRGRVFDEQGRPVAGARVNPLSKTGAESFDEPDYVIKKEGVVTSGPDGVFELVNLTPGRETVKVEHPDYCFQIVSNIELREGAAVDVKIVLSRGATVQGHVYDAGGKPNANEPLGFQDASYGGGSTRPPYFGFAKTDANGFYKVEHLPEQLCYATRGMFAEGVEGQSILPVAGTTLTLDLGGTNRVSGRLVDGGKPIAGCRVVVATVTGQSFRANAKTDAQGAFSIYGIPSGRRILYAEDIDHNHGGWRELKKIEITPEMVEKGTALDVGDVTRPLGRAVITVKDPQQRPPDRLRVYLIYPHTDPSMPAFGSGHGESVGPNEYVINDVSPGQYKATVSPKSGGFGFGRMFEMKEGQAEARVTVALTTGTAVVQGNYTLGPNRRAVLIRSDLTLSAYITPRGKKYRVEDLPAGEYLLCDEEFRLMAPVGRIKVGEGEAVTLDIGGPAWNKLTVGFLSVKVFTEAGQTLPGAKVWLERQGAKLQPAGDYDYTQNFAGDPGPGTLHVVYPGYKESRQTVEMRALPPTAFLEPVWPAKRNPLPTVLVRLERE